MEAKRRIDAHSASSEFLISLSFASLLTTDSGYEDAGIQIIEQSRV
jgi:hypothetical protein